MAVLVKRELRPKAQLPGDANKGVFVAKNVPDREVLEWTPIPDPTKLTTDAVNAAIDRIRELYDLRFEQLDLRLEQRFQAQEKAVGAALIAADLKISALADKIERLAAELPKSITREEYAGQYRALVDRLEGLLADTKNLITRPEYVAQHQALEEKVDDLRTQSNREIGRMSAPSAPNQQIVDLQQALQDLSVRYATTVGHSSGSRYEDRLDAIAEQLRINSTNITQSAGRQQGGNAAWIYLIGAVGLLSTVIGIVLAVTK